MLINFWSCEYMDYDWSWDGENEERYYMCRHPNGSGNCDIPNKFGGVKEDCKLLDVTPNSDSD